MLQNVEEFHKNGSKTVVSAARQSVRQEASNVKAADLRTIYFILFTADEFVQLKSEFSVFKRFSEELLDDMRKLTGNWLIILGSDFLLSYKVSFVKKGIGEVRCWHTTAHAVSFPKGFV